MLLEMAISLSTRLWATWRVWKVATVSMHSTTLKLRSGK